jgi:N-sulfoglucosamine sulfohydrolase
MDTITGKSFTSLLTSKKEGLINSKDNYVLIGMERHDIGRPQDRGYPIRGIFRDGYLYLHNFDTSRWPAGHPHTGYMNTDSGPTKTEILNARAHSHTRHYWQWNVGMRPTEELYHVDSDEDCIHNLADSTTLLDLKSEMKKQLFKALKEQSDPRIFGNGDIFDSYPFGRDTMINFYDNLMAGQQEDLGWHSPEDVQAEKE